MFFGIGCDIDLRRQSLETIQARFGAAELGELRYYNPAIHAAAFALPNYMRTLIAGV